MLSEHGCKIAPNTYYVHKKRPRRPGPCVTSTSRRDRPGGHAKPRGLRRRQGLDPAQPRGHPGGPLHRRAPDAGPGPFGGPAGPGLKVTTRSDERQHRPGRPGRPQLQGAGAQPALGGRSHLREDPRRLGLRRLHHRRVLPHGGRLADLQSLAIGPRHRRLGDGGVEPHPRRPGARRTDSSIATGACNIFDSLFRASGRKRHRRLGRMQRRFLRQCHGREPSTASTSGS